MTAVQQYPVTPVRPVPPRIPRPPYVGREKPEPYTGPAVQSAEVIEKMRAAGQLAARALAETGSHVTPGITTDELDAIAHAYLCDHGAYPSTVGYRGFPKAICTSINEVICHGIPDQRPLEDGDLIKIDLTAYVDGVHGDNCATFFCGDVPEESRLLSERTHEAMMRGIRAAKPGRQVNVIGKVIESYAKRFGYGVVHDYTGHGVHTAFHSGLVIPHYDAPHFDDVIEVGMTFTVEPMITLGGTDWEMWDDDWTVLTTDRSRVAQWEHTVVINPDGAEILTLP
ncbi:type I methionyl aminopeptidase [Enemella dayhoffiae]|uniref:Methionine aminopeptidase n=1 Tax=Enemella dayhoffiae TaxID=2016507 RepID=A0A255H1C7_9ACTN|nr:type I methionyl aminopeptidase [Enemella dayhoffiae]OYO21515.1 type I methionyl aminopeptidase [Enemella dayhoffiae]